MTSASDGLHPFLLHLLLAAAAGALLAWWLVRSTLRIRRREAAPQEALNQSLRESTRESPKAALHQAAFATSRSDQTNTSTTASSR